MAFLKTPQGVLSSQWDQFLSPDRQEIWVSVELLLFRPTRSCGVCGRTWEKSHRPLILLVAVRLNGIISDSNEGAHPPEVFG